MAWERSKEDAEDGDRKREKRGHGVGRDRKRVLVPGWEELRCKL